MNFLYSIMDSFSFNFIQDNFMNGTHLAYFIVQQMLSVLIREGGRVQQSRLYSLIRFVWSFLAGGGNSMNSWTLLSSLSLFSGLFVKSERASLVPSSLNWRSRQSSCFRRWEWIHLSRIYASVCLYMCTLMKNMFIQVFY